jgi:hypothetical protein
MDYKQPAVEAVSAKVTYLASGSAFMFGMTANEVAAVGSLVIALLAFVVNTITNWHFKNEHLKLAKAKARADGAEVDDE